MRPLIGGGTSGVSFRCCIRPLFSSSASRLEGDLEHSAQSDWLDTEQPSGTGEGGDLTLSPPDVFNFKHSTPRPSLALLPNVHTPSHFLMMNGGLVNGSR